MLISPTFFYPILISTLIQLSYHAPDDGQNIHYDEKKDLFVLRILHKHDK